MRRAGVLLVSALVASALATGSGATRLPAKLRIVAASPLTVAGSGFHARERIRLTASAGGMTETVRIRATRLGTFRVLLERVGPTRCDLIRVVATGLAGASAVLKRLPPPACIAQRAYD